MPLADAPAWHTPLPSGCMSPPIRYAERVVQQLWQRQAGLSAEIFFDLQRAITLSPALTTFADHHRTSTSAASIHIGVGQLISLQAFAPTVKRHRTGQFYAAREVVVCEILFGPASAGG
jgi:hypothetical protein